MKQHIHSKLARIIKTFGRVSRHAGNWFSRILTADVYLGRSMVGLPPGSIVLFPYHESMLCCGIAAIVSFNIKKATTPPRKLALLDEMAATIQNQSCETCRESGYNDIEGQYLGGDALIDSLWQAAQSLKSEKSFYSIYTNADEQKQLADIGWRLSAFAASEMQVLAAHMSRIPAQKAELMSARIEKLKDIPWCIHNEILNNISQIKDLCRKPGRPLQPSLWRRGGPSVPLELKFRRLTQSVGDDAKAARGT